MDWKLLKEWIQKQECITLQCSTGNTILKLSDYFKLIVIALEFSDFDAIISILTYQPFACLVLQCDLQQKLVVITGLPLPKQ